MAPVAVQISDMLNTLEQEDYEMAISYIQYLADKRKKERVGKAKEVMNGIRNLIGNDTGWTSEEEMIEDMAKFRKERMGL